MFTEKELFALVAILLTFIGYIPYIRDILLKKTKPHVYTWGLWSLMASIAFALQISHDAGAGALVTLAAAIVCFIIFMFGLKNGHQIITRSDTIFLVTALLAIIIWVYAKQPLLSAALISMIDILGFAPTVRKSWHDPHSETLISFQVNVVRHTLALFALQSYSAITLMYPLVSLIATVMFCLMIIMRRRQLSYQLVGVPR